MVRAIHGALAAGEYCWNGAFEVGCPSSLDRVRWAWPTFLVVLFTHAEWYAALGRRAQTVTEALPYSQYAFAVIERKSHAPTGQVPIQQPHAVQSDALTWGKPVSSLKERAPVGHASMQAWHPLHCCASVVEV